MNKQELEALKKANNRLYNLAAIADEIDNAKATLEEFILEAEDELYKINGENGKHSEDVEEFIAVLDKARDDLDDIATWSVRTMDERLTYAEVTV